MLNARVALLGPVVIEGRTGALVEPGGTLAKAFIAALAASPTCTLSVDTIVDELWGDDRPRNAKAALQTLVSRVRQVAADGIVVSSPAGYALDVEPTRTDAGIARAALTASGADALATLESALALWRGEPGADLGDAPVRTAVEEDAAALREQLLLRRARLLMEAGEPGRAADDLAALASARPFDEGVHTDHIAALHSAGRTAEALAAFADYRSRLRDELGTSPGPRLVELNTLMLQEGETRPSATVRIGLRAAPNELIGRDHDVSALERALAGSRVVTILGAGGLGKTRLAHEIAARSEAPAVIVVELASVRSDADVTLALASTLGIREITAGQRLQDLVGRPEVTSRIASQLSERPTLLVLDNCEQVIDAVARWCSELVASAPRLRILTTSRSPLAIPAETVYPLDPLASTDGDDEPGPAVRLFLDRARAVRPTAALPIATIERLCTRLDGLPLAIELAAARVRTMTPEQIEARLEHRFALLRGGDRSAPERHRTLFAVIEWSWNLLREPEQAALRSLSLFPDGFSADAAAAVTGHSPVDDVLEALVDQSLLSITDDGESLRYRMLETVREFGQDELNAANEADAARDALFEWASALTEAALARYTSTESYFAIRREQDNLVAVLRAAMAAGRPDIVVSVFGALGYYWSVSSAHSEVVAFGAEVLESLRGYHPDAAHVDATVLGYVLIATTALTVAESDSLRAMAMLRRQLRELPPRSADMLAIGEFLAAVPDFGRAMEVLERMRASRDDSTALLGAMIASQLAENNGEFDDAVAAATRAFELGEKLGDLWRSSMAAMMLAELSSQSADPVAALRWVDYAEHGMRVLHAKDDLMQIGWMRGSALLGAGRLSEARALFERMLDDHDADSTVPPEMASMGRFGLAELTRLEGDLESAADQYRSALSAFRARGQRTSPWFLLAASGLISAAGTDGTFEEAEIARWAARLRSRTLALFRVRPEYVDKPVLGTSGLGFSAWALRHPQLQDRALELLAVSERLHPRQDLPSLRVAEHLARAERIVGAERVQKARAAASALSLDECTARAHELFALPVG